MFAGHEHIRAEKFKFFLQLDYYMEDPDIQGIIGLSPRDESAGPLLVDYLFEQGSIPERQFGILLSLTESRPSYF